MSNAMFEQLESRKLMAIVVDVRLPGGGKEATVGGIGSTVNVEIWATVTGENEVTTDDGLQIAVGSLLSTDISGGAVRGNLSATTTAPFNALGSSNGAQADLDADGDLDVGDNVSTVSGSKFLFARSASMTTTGGTTVTKGQSFKIADAVFTVTSFLTGVRTDLVYRVRGGSNQVLAQVDGQTSSGTFVAGSGVQLVRAGTGSIQGRVFNDKNANGIFDGADVGISGFRVFLDKDFDGQLDANEISKPVSTTGTYTFSNVVSGIYRVREVFREGWRQTFPALGYYEVVLAYGAQARSQSFANTDTVLIKGKVWMDANVNHKLDSGEAGLPNWMLYIDHNENGILDKGDDWTLSDGNGNYRFFNLPAGNFHVHVVQQTGYRQTAPSGGFHNITLAAGGTTSNKNFGEKRLK